MAQKILTKKEVLEKYSAGPDTGIFTDGGARPNPGRGGWGVVVVKDNKIYKELSGSEKHTTNNRMEYTALIEAMKLLQPLTCKCISIFIPFPSGMGFNPFKFYLR